MRLDLEQLRKTLIAQAIVLAWAPVVAFVAADGAARGRPDPAGPILAAFMFVCSAPFAYLRLFARAPGQHRVGVAAHYLSAGWGAGMAALLTFAAFADHGGKAGAGAALAGLCAVNVCVVFCAVASIWAHFTLPTPRFAPDWQSAAFSLGERLGSSAEPGLREAAEGSGEEEGGESEPDPAEPPEPREAAEEVRAESPSEPPRSQPAPADSEPLVRAPESAETARKYAVAVESEYKDSYPSGCYHVYGPRQRVLVNGQEIVEHNVDIKYDDTERDGYTDTTIHRPCLFLGDAEHLLCFWIHGDILYARVYDPAVHLIEEVTVDLPPGGEDRAAPESMEQLRLQHTEGSLGAFFSKFDLGRGTLVWRYDFPPKIESALVKALGLEAGRSPSRFES